MKIWANGEWTEIEIGQRVFIGTCGGWHSVFGEYGTLVRVTKRHCIFRSDSGSEVKTLANNMMVPSKNWGDWFVSLATERKFIQQRPSYWDSKKMELCYK